MPIVSFYGLLACVIAVAMIALVIMSVAGGRAGALKKQGVAWTIAIAMIVLSVGIGQVKARGAGQSSPAPEPTMPPSVAPVTPAKQNSYVYDEAGVLSSSAIKKLDRRNEKLLEDMDVLIAVITCNNEGDLYDYALERAEEMGLGEYDFVVVMDIAGESGGIVQGAGLYNEGWFSDEDCTKYAKKYMEKPFHKGDYDKAALSVTEALEEWYYDNY